MLSPRNVYSKFGLCSPISRLKAGSDAKTKHFVKYGNKTLLGEIWTIKIKLLIRAGRIIFENIFESLWAHKNCPSLEEFGKVLNSLLPEFVAFSLSLVQILHTISTNKLENTESYTFLCFIPHPYFQLFVFPKVARIKTLKHKAHKLIAFSIKKQRDVCSLKNLTTLKCWKGS